METLTFTDLNAEFDNILNNALSLVSPWTANMAAGGFRLTGLGLGTAGSPSLQFTGDTDTGIFSSGANTLDLATAGTSWLTLSNVGVLTANGTTGAVRLHNLTTAQRDALTPAAGMMCYNTTTSAVNVYTNAWRTVQADATFTSDSATVATTESTSSTSWTDLATAGPSVTVTVGASGVLILHYSAYLLVAAGGIANVDFALSGANTRAANEATAIAGKSSGTLDERFGTTTRLTGLNAGSTTVTLKYRSPTATFSASFTYRHLVVLVP